MLDLKRQYGPMHQELLDALEHVLETQQFILGEPVAAFERAAASQLGVAHAMGCSSGTDALWLALAAAGIGPGDAVLTTPFSFFASVSAILRAGATPVLADIDPDYVQSGSACGREASLKRRGVHPHQGHSARAPLWSMRRLDRLHPAREMSVGSSSLKMPPRPGEPSGWA
jgi:hypothetical protein